MFKNYFHIESSWISTAIASESKNEKINISEISGYEIIDGQYIKVQLNKAERATVVVFLSAVCPCSESHQPALIDLAKQYTEKGINFIGIHSNANESIFTTREKFSQIDLKKRNHRTPIFPFPIIQDDNAQLADQFRAKSTPHVFVVNKNMEILFKGGIDNSNLAENASRHYLRDALKAISEDLDPPEKEVRVLGCEIKRP